MLGSAGLIRPAGSQAPAPLADRQVHPHIAPLAPTAVLHGACARFQYADSLWNFGEGFVAGNGDADSGGWHGNDDGTDVTIDDVHAPLGWHTWTWNHPAHPASGMLMSRLWGFLRPDDGSSSSQLQVPLPTEHPLYGPVTSGPFALLQPPDPRYPADAYVDQAAFELFRPVTQAAENAHIVICIQQWQTAFTPKDFNNDAPAWNHLSRGIFSPDGLIRDEFGAQRDVANFQQNTSTESRLVAAEGVYRPDPSIIVRDEWQDTYYPIFGYVVNRPVRNTTLNEQRDLQLVQAIKEILMDVPGNGLNPLPVALTAAEVDSRVTVILIGGSNGGLQAKWGMLRYPHIVHGALSEVINPSMQRMFGEFDMKHAAAHLGGTGGVSKDISNRDFLIWGQYAFSQNRWIHDLSHLMRQLRGTAPRPCCYWVSDEDITSTGTDWIRLIDGGGWSGAGQASGMSTYTDSLGGTHAVSHEFSWTVADNFCHGEGPVRSPYPPPSPTGVFYHGFELSHEVAVAAIAHHTATLGLTPPAQPPTSPPLSPPSLRELDDPHEWALGRPGVAVQADAGLSYDATWFERTQPGAAGTMLGYEESMLVHDGAVYVGSADGVVSRFVVAASTEQELLKVAHTNPGDATASPPWPGTPMSLGHQAYALVASQFSGRDEIVAGTRRHLYRLDPDDLTVNGSVELPWAIAQPRRLLYVASTVLPSYPGPKLVYCSVHGGLVFCEPDLSPVYEWPEPGIVDFLVQGDQVTIASLRGVLATVSFPDLNGSPDPQLHAASKPIRRGLLSFLTAQDPADPSLDLDCQGRVADLELMRVSGGGSDKWISASGGYVRSHDVGTLLMQPKPGAFRHLIDLQNATILDIATCNKPGDAQDDPGDHVVVLSGNNLQLFDHNGSLLGEKTLNKTAHPSNSHFPAGEHAHALAVGELVANSGTYGQEVVVATHCGSLFWMHVDELAAAGTELPSPAFDRALGNGVQPRTNQHLSATWAVSQRAAHDQDLHVLTQAGAYWRLDPDVPAPTSHLVDSTSDAINMKGWSDLDNRDQNQVHQPLSASAFFNPASGNLSVLPSPPELSIIATGPWAPLNSRMTFYEESGSYLAGNWFQDTVLDRVFQGFALHPRPGCQLIRATSEREIWHWSSRGVAPPPPDKTIEDDWANLVQAYRVDLATLQVDQTWASTHVPDSAGIVPHHRLRSRTASVEVMNQQAIRAFQLTDGRTVIVLGCPGGTVRVMIIDGMRENDTSPHDLVDPNESWESSDLGFGGAGLAVRDDGNDHLTIWFGTLQHHCKRPGSTGVGGQLADDEVATGAIHRFTWDPVGGLVSMGQPLVFYPNTPGLARGGYAVVGIDYGDVLDSPGAEDEVVVATLGGDVIVLDENLGTVLWHAEVPGAVGCYGAIKVADIDGIAGNEIYVSGSFGVWRFTQ